MSYKLAPPRKGPAVSIPPTSPRIVTSKTSHTTAADDRVAEPATDFERSLAELEAIVDKLEDGELSLDDSLRQFERGVQLTRVCQGALKQAEQKVEILLRRSGAEDDFATAPFATDDDSER